MRNRYLDAQICPPDAVHPTFSQISRLGGELDGVRQQIEHDLARGALITPNTRHALLKHS